MNKNEHDTFPVSRGRAVQSDRACRIRVSRGELFNEKNFPFASMFNGLQRAAGRVGVARAAV